MTSDALTSRRNNTIDAFRGIAILGVLVYHYSLRWAPPWNVANLYGYRHAWPNWLVLGALGVHVFFVISGLVITMTVLRSKSALEFAVRRFARLYPAFLVGIGITLAATGIFPIPGYRVSPADVLANLTMEAPAFHRYFVDGSYWTLCVEIKFYALAALSFALFRERFWMAVAGIAALGFVVFEFGTTRQILLVPYAPLFLAGMAIWFAVFEEKWLPALVLAGESLVLYGAYRHSFELPRVSPWLCHLCIILPVAALVILLAFGRNTRMGPLAPIGRISYSLYLIHQNLGVIIIARLTAIGFADIWAFAVATAVAIALAALMFRFVEQPGQRAVMMGYRGLTAARNSADLPGLIPGSPKRGPAITE